MRVAVFLGSALWLAAADPSCPAYPKQQYAMDLERIRMERTVPGPPKKNSGPRKAAGNLIDDHIFGAMAADGIEPAPQSSDTEFLRRVMIDLTGRIPTPERVEQFTADSNPGKRAALIDELIGSPEYVDQIGKFYSNLFEVTSGFYNGNYVGIPGRNLFYNYLRDFIARDRPYQEVAAEMIAGIGDTHRSGPLNFIARGFAEGDPIQDTWDALTDRVTTKFLGHRTECVSCHDGRNHLEQINLYLTGRRREDFWRHASFFSRVVLTSVPFDVLTAQRKFIVSDRTSGGYHAVVPLGNPGPRPLRQGGPYEPTYVFTGEQPKSGDWRKELARMLTTDRQFARAAVNYLWDNFFNVGIVDPPDGWDLSRIDRRNPPPAPWTIQPSHPELLEALADEFIRTGYSVRSIVRLIASSDAYQLSSRYPGEWKPQYLRYFAKHIPRRLTSEEIWDALSIATLSQRPMWVEGFDQPMMYAAQLPDPTEPRTDGSIVTFLGNFGRGNWWTTARDSRPTVLQVLYLMNDSVVNSRTFATAGSSGTRVAQLMQSDLSDGDAVTRLYLASLGRPPSEQEMSAALANKMTRARQDWLSDVQWALVNKLDFIFNY